MRYLIVGGFFILAGLIAAVALGRAAGRTLVFILGALGTIAAATLFYFNKSDSVADTAIEHIADFTPPLISFSLVMGWWIGFMILPFWRKS